MIENEPFFMELMIIFLFIPVATRKLRQLLTEANLLNSF